ncbi:MAG: NapC/NirT family cytochrome c [Magnetococcales bacterium]|nr:NapC/NirT family cytochrome c [Magnetococcales bacterium]
MRPPQWLRTSLLILITAIFVFGASNVSASETTHPKKSKEEIGMGKECLSCHTNETPGLVTEWKESKHSGKNVDCYDCHKAKEGEVGAYKHRDYDGKAMYITTIVTPKRCAECHEKEVAQQQRSHHAKAGGILASLDGILGEVIGGPQAVNAGCRQCHGGKVELDQFNRPTPQTWPNTGIGRINPDGSLGSCAACHGRHRFSSAQARTPDTCGKCHMGPDHPQIEVYDESKHGIIYRAKMDEMNLDSAKWVAGVDYSAAPTCATCHISATLKQKVTHDVGERISWTLRPAVSTKLNMIRLANGDEFDQPEGEPLPAVGDEVKGSKVTEILTWEQRRKNMKDVCRACHAPKTADGHYKQFDDVVELYNEKFAKPISAIMKELQDKGYVTAAPFDDKIKWTWFEIWHHEGRRARHGASMMGPDYTWWHGIYEVAQHTYFKWIPELKEVVRRKDGNEDFANALLEKYFKPIDGHAWYFNGISKDALDNVRKGYEERYGKGTMK